MKKLSLIIGIIVLLCVPFIWEKKPVKAEPVKDVIKNVTINIITNQDDDWDEPEPTPKPKKVVKKARNYPGYPKLPAYTPPAPVYTPAPVYIQPAPVYVPPVSKHCDCPPPTRYLTGADRFQKAE